MRLNKSGFFCIAAHVEINVSRLVKIEHRLIQNHRLAWQIIRSGCSIWNHGINTINRIELFRIKVNDGKVYGVIFLQEKYDRQYIHRIQQAAGDQKLLIRKVRLHAFRGHEATDEFSNFFLLFHVVSRCLPEII